MPAPLALAFLFNTVDFFRIAHIVKPHGLKGEVTIALHPDCPDLSGVKSVFLEIRGQRAPYFLQAISVKGTTAFVKFEEVTSVEEAQAIRGSVILLPRDARPRLQKNEFYDDEVPGFKVFDQHETLLGTVQRVEHMGATRHLIVVHDGREVMIPLNGPFVQSVNKSRKVITVSLPDGFLDL